MPLGTLRSRYLVYSYTGLLVDMGVRLIGGSRWLWVARLVCWWHVRVQNPYRIGVVIDVGQREAPTFFASAKEFRAFLEQIDKEDKHTS
jgi:hypothetical protein